MEGTITPCFANLFPDPAEPGSIPSDSKIFSEEKIVHVAKVIQWHCLEENRTVA